MAAIWCWCPSATTPSCSTLWWKTDPEFEIDKDIDNKLLISVAPDGYLKRVA
jgi:cephalosporin hydroxylase